MPDGQKHQPKSATMPRGPVPDTLRITLPPAEALKRLLKPAPKAEKPAKRP